METRHFVECYFGGAFRMICHHCGVIAACSRNTLKFVEDFLRFYGKRSLTVKFSKF